MDIWTLWLAALELLLEWLSSTLGLGLGATILAATFLLRAALLPLSWPAGYRGLLRKKKMEKLAPELQKLRDRLGHEPQAYVKELNAFYRKHDLTLFDGKAVFAALAQFPVFVGFYRVLLTVGENVRFLWIANLAKPDVLLAIVAGATTALMMALNPDLPDQVRVAMILIPTIIAVVAALQFSSALAVYWTASNCFSMLQTAALHAVVNKRIRSRTLRM
jgi:YidC/Oxa1 family membrane protein insertase